MLVITGDRVGPAMAGPAIRAWEIARVLAGDGHAVVLASPWLDAELPSGGEGVRCVVGWGDALRPLVAASDVVVAMTGVLYEHDWLAEVRHTRGPQSPDPLWLVADAYDPVLFEVLAGDGDRPLAERQTRASDASIRMCDPLRWVDLVLCATESQRLLLLGVLAAWGRIGPTAWDDDQRLGSAVSVVPFGLPSTPPATGPHRHPLRQPEGPFGGDDTILLWGGGLWDWLDPVTLVEAVARLENPTLKVFFMAGTHPTPSVPVMAMVAATRDAAAALGLDERGTGQIRFADDWIPYAERGTYLTDATIGVALAPDHAESVFAHRTRVLDYLWASLPVLYSAPAGVRDDLASLIGDHDLGAVVNPGDADGCASAIGRLIEPGWYAGAQSRIAAVAQSLTWPIVARPLRDFCTEPRTLLSEPPASSLRSGASGSQRSSVRRLASGLRRRLGGGPSDAGAGVGR